MTNQKAVKAVDTSAAFVAAPFHVLAAVITQAKNIVTREPLVTAAGVYAAETAVRGGSWENYVAAGVLALLREVVTPAWKAADGTPQ